MDAEEEVQLAQDIEVGLYAEYLLNHHSKDLTRAKKRDCKVLARQGKKARSHLLEANLRLVVSCQTLHRSWNATAGPDPGGNQWSIRAMEKFDYAKGFKFSRTPPGGFGKPSLEAWQTSPALFASWCTLWNKLNKISRIKRELYQSPAQSYQRRTAEESGLEESRIEMLLRQSWTP